MEFFTPGHLIVIAIVALVLFFGWKQLPDMARSVGRSLRVFKTEIKGMSADDKARNEAEQSGADTTASPEAAEPRRLESTPQRQALPQAEIVRRPIGDATNGAAADGSAQPARSRPRPTPRPDGRARVNN